MVAVVNFLKLHEQVGVHTKLQSKSFNQIHMCARLNGKGGDFKCFLIFQVSCKLILYHCKNSSFNNDKWDGANLFLKNLDSCKFISDTILQNTASSTAIFSLQLAEYKPVSQCMVHSIFRFYFLCFHFCCFWQEGKGRKAQRNPSFSAVLFSLFFKQGVLPCYSTQGSVQPHETAVSKPDCSELP